MSNLGRAIRRGFLKRVRTAFRRRTRLPLEPVDPSAWLAIARSRELQAIEVGQQAEMRAAALARELVIVSAELLHVQSLRLPAAAAAQIEQDVSSEIAELRNLFAGLEKRRSGQHPRVTVVIPAYGKPDYTARCLRSIAVNWPDRINPVVVLVDDLSPDASGAVFVGLTGVELLFNGENIGYLRSTNRGAALCATSYIFLLNNDTEVQAGWLDHLVQVLEEDPTIGAAGSKLIYPDGRLQEAGSIIWSDATGWNYGRGDDPSKSAYNFIRDVDYCSAASLLIRAELFRDIGGFDERFAPAYYEDADLCFEIRRRGYRVVYEPRSEVIHHEGVSSGTDITSGTKRFQETNRHTFADKWAAELERQYIASPSNVERASQRKITKDSILIIDTYVPLHDREAGSNRLFKIIKILISLDYHVVFMPENYAVVEPYTSDLIRLGVEVVCWRGSGIAHDQALIAVLPRVRIVWICRPELCKKYTPIVRSAGTAAILYDTVDLHFLRQRRRAEIEQSGDERWRETMALELACARSVDATITVTHVEREELLAHGIRDVIVVPTIHDIEMSLPVGFDARSGLVFIGGYNHAPNVDGAVWLCKEIMPIVWRTLPNVRVTLLGNAPTDEVRALGTERVLVTGYLADVAPYFEESRVFVAPLRYGAGMKGKIGHALSFGIPVITTHVGAEGYDLEHDTNCIIADDAPSFARGIIALYTDRSRWTACARSGRDVIASVGSEAVGRTLSAIVRQYAAVPDGVGTETVVVSR